jgi:hypothetical protein
MRREGEFEPEGQKDGESFEKRRFGDREHFN